MPSFEDLTGKKIGHLTVMYRASDWIQPSGQHKRMWHCICECGNECDVRASDIKSGNTTSCGCQSSKKKSIGLEDLTGKQFGDFIVIKRAPNRITPSGQQTRVWHCKCKKCGLEKDIQASQIKHFSGKCTCSKKKVEHDLCGYTFDKLKVQKFDKNVNGKKYWLCDCECGNKNISIEEWRLLSGKKKSCGCQTKKKSEEQRIEKICKLKKSLLDVNPLLAEEWHPLKNNNLRPELVTANCNKKVWWLGKCGHEWEATVGARNRGTGCPICSNHRTLKGFNDIEMLYPEVLSEWDYEKNEVLPEEISSLNTRIWWKCNLGHSYSMKISLRVGKQKCGCPYCSVPAKKVLKGFNDLATTHPDTLKEWDYQKNNIKPEEVSAGSSKKIWWKCKEGHSFEQVISYKARSEKKSTCPYCSNQKLLKGYNDLATTHAYILDEWDYIKNEVSPTEIGVGTHKKIWWKCPFGHSYQSYPSSRCGKQHTGCPICDKENHTSFPEQAVFYYIKKYFPDTVNCDKARIGMELDIYIPHLDIAIEYDGRNWHKDNAFELKKNEACKEKNVLLIRVREEGLELYDDCICLVRNNVRSNKSLSKVIDELLKMTDNINGDIDVDRDAGQIYSTYIKTRKEKSLASVFPQIADEWHPTKNGDLMPMMVAPSANKKVWWLGKCGHEYQMDIQSRTNQNSKCPYCSGKKVLPGFNDFETWCKINDRMVLLEEWDYSRNRILPSEVTKASDKLTFWKCKKCSNVWKTKVDSRTRMRSGCPRCASYYRNAKAVVNLDMGKVYDSILEAEKELGINRACIGNVCRGKQKKAGGYRWTYYK